MTYIEENFIMKAFNDTTMTESIFSSEENEEYKSKEFNVYFDKVFGEKSTPKKSSLISCTLQSGLESFVTDSTVKEVKGKTIQTKVMQRRMIQRMRRQVNKGIKLNEFIVNKDMTDRRRSKLLNKEDKLIDCMIEYIEGIMAKV